MLLGRNLGRKMIVGIGTDIIEIERVSAEIEKERLLEKYFSEDEIKFLNDQTSSRTPTAASCFAAKEAFSKALGTGVRGFILKEVEILRDEKGKLIMRLSGDAKQVALSRGARRYHVSISHCKEYAMATVILEK
ncbi:MAG: holo-ACP synthase [Oscillospiraceae bacterium]|nr:holo-ACP synthase [Oscillospiraceae bacterium]